MLSFKQVTRSAVWVLLGTVVLWCWMVLGVLVLAFLNYLVLFMDPLRRRILRNGLLIRSLAVSR